MNRIIQLHFKAVFRFHLHSQLIILCVTLITKFDPAEVERCSLLLPLFAHRIAHLDLDFNLFIFPIHAPRNIHLAVAID